MSLSDKEYSDEDDDGSYKSDYSGSQTERSYYSEDEAKKIDSNRKKDNKSGKKPLVQKKNQPLVRGLKRDMNKKRGVGSTGGGDHVTDKMLSESKIKIGELRNKNSELLELIAKYEYENRDLMRIIRKQERQLKTFQEQENSMPVLLQRQSAESHALCEQIRNLKEKLRNQEKKMKAADEELEQKQKHLKKLKGLVEDSQLLEREELNKKLINAERELEMKVDTIRNLERHIENLNKNHKHELGLKKVKQQTTASEMDSMKNELERLRTQLQEKEKELAVLNIYAQQRTQMRQPHRLNSSIRSTPVFDQQGNPQSMRGKKGQKDVKHHSHDGGVRTQKMFNGINGTVNQKRSLSPELMNHTNKGNPMKVDKADAQQFLNNSKAPAATTAAHNGPTANKDNNNVTKPKPTYNEKQLRGINEERNHKDKERDEVERRIEEMEKQTKMKVMYRIDKPNDQNKKTENSNNKENAKAKELEEKQKEILLAKMKELDENNNNKKFSTKQSVNKSLFDNDDELQFTSYKPSFLNDSNNFSSRSNAHKPTTKPVSVKKKDELFSELFDDKNKNDDDDFLFGAKKLTSTSTTTSKSPVFLSLNNNNNSSRNVQQTSKSQLLPKRTKQAKSLATLNGIESDDEEEIRELKFK